ncbi:MAG: hypothetical protein LW817_06030 [Candidatus Caenarcaniphilales bacterium]|jgi:hypothetical protein|nr:hypothetical protein [Candidatus Caenarcaniphilales bacterium]
MPSTIDSKKNTSVAQAKNVKTAASANTISESSKASISKSKKIDTKSLHSEPKTIEPYNFSKIKAGDENLEPEVDRILGRYGINASEIYNNAVLSKDKNTLVIATKGETALQETFGGASGFSRVMYSMFGWLPRIFGAPRKNIAANFYKRWFNSGANDSAAKMYHEDIKKLFTGLKENHYHAVTVFYRNSKTGKFEKDPAAVAITDSYLYLMRQRAQEEGLGVQVKQHLESKLAKTYAVDKVIPLRDEKEAMNFYALFHQIAEGLYQAQHYDLLALPGAPHSDSHTVTEDLSFVQLPWFKLAQNDQSRWKIFGSKKYIEKNPNNLTEASKKELLENLIDQPNKITFVRPKDQAQDALSTIYADCDAWQSMYSGSELRTIENNDHEIAKSLIAYNETTLERYNQELKGSSK